MSKESKETAKAHEAKADESLAEKVKSWLAGEGFPFEMHVANALSSNGFWIQQALYYTDEATGKSREIDVVATSSEWVKERSTNVVVNLVAECKYSRDKPFVLLTTARPPACPIVGGSNRVFTDESGKTLLGNVQISDVEDHPFLTGPPVSAYSAVSAFRRKDAPTDEAFAAPLAAAKASHALAKASAGAMSIGKAVGNTECNIWMPVVIVDGPVFTAALVGPGDLAVKPISWGRLLLKNPDTGSRETAVDIVSIDALETYSQNVRRSLAHIKSQITAEPAIAKDPSLGLAKVMTRLQNALGKNDKKPAT